jgi:hypothetical protein
LLLRRVARLLLRRVARLLLRISRLLSVSGLLLRIARLLLLRIARLLPVSGLSVSRLSLLPRLGILRRGLLFFTGAHGGENERSGHQTGRQ